MLAVPGGAGEQHRKSGQMSPPAGHCYYLAISALLRSIINTLMRNL